MAAWRDWDWKADSRAMSSLMSGMLLSEGAVTDWWSEKESVEYGKEIEERAERNAGRLFMVRR